MTHIELHSSGPRVSRIVLGAWRLADRHWETRDLRALVEACLELGVTTFDHADIYGDYRCESLFGAVLREAPSLRAGMQIVSKCGIKLVSERRPGHCAKLYDSSGAHIRASVDRSLQELGTDYLDLLLLHRPDPLMDADETAAALSELVAHGKVRHLGVSNHLPAQFDVLTSRLTIPLVTNQIELSVLQLQAFADGTLDQCQRLRVAPMAWSPLAGGTLLHGSQPREQRVREQLRTVGLALGGASVDQVALAWLLRHPARVVPILGTSRLPRVRDAVAALDLELTREQWFAIWCASNGAEVP